jgi:hypothetical protein
MSKFLEYIEPDEQDNPKTIRVSVEEAIKKSKLVAAEYADYTYESDEEALQDFIAVNWAYWVEVEEE